MAEAKINIAQGDLQIPGTKVKVPKWAALGVGGAVIIALILMRGRSSVPVSEEELPALGQDDVPSTGPTPSQEDFLAQLQALRDSFAGDLSDIAAKLAAQQEQQLLMSSPGYPVSYPDSYSLAEPEQLVEPEAPSIFRMSSPGVYSLRESDAGYQARLRASHRGPTSTTAPATTSRISTPSTTPSFSRPTSTQQLKGSSIITLKEVKITAPKPRSTQQLKGSQIRTLKEIQIPKPKPKPTSTQQLPGSSIRLLKDV